MKDPRELAVMVGSGSTVVLPKNENRRCLLLINDSDVVMYLTVIDGSEAALNSGIRLNPNGGSIMFDSIVPTSCIKAIATAPDKRLLITESNNE